MTSSWNLVYSNPKLVVRVEQASSLSGQDAQLTNQIGLLYQISYQFHGNTPFTLSKQDRR